MAATNLMRNTACALISLALLAGCASTLNSDSAPADWPELKVVTIIAPVDEMLAACTWNDVLLSDVACALIDFNRKLCTIVFRDDRPIVASVMTHELGHCGGKDHPGEDTLRRAWEKWKSQR